MKNQHSKPKPATIVGSKIYRKTRKLIRTPKRFFLDSYIGKKIFNEVPNRRLDINSKVLSDYEAFSIAQFKKDLQIGKLSKSVAQRRILRLWKTNPWSPKLIKAYIYLLESDEKLKEIIAFLDVCLKQDRVSDDIKFLYVNMLRKSGKYDIELTLTMLEALLSKKPLDFNVRYFLCQFLWESQGTSPVLYKHIKILQQSNKDLSITQKNFICACLYEFGRYNDVRKYYYPIRDAIEKRYFTLEMMYEIEVNEDENSRKILNKINAFQTEFEKYIRESENIAVVGNAPTELNRGNGDVIDSADLVIRFNNFSTGGEFGNDYGYRTDIWVKGGYFQDIQRRNVSSYKGIIQSGNNPIYRNSSFRDFYFDAFITDTNFTCIPTKIYYDLIRLIGTSPSAGLAILYWIYMIRGKIPKSWVFGFSFGNQKNNSSEHYFQNNNAGKYYPHNWDKEAELLNQIMID